MVGNLDHKIKEIDNLLVDCIENYHSPERFFTYSHSLIQSLRNFTFAVQANKKQIPNFDTWYLPWQEAMKADPYMKWLNSKRTQVVHKDIIASRSFAALTTLPDYSEAWVKKYFDYHTSTTELIDSAKKIVQKNPGLAHSTMQIERAYLIDIDKSLEELVSVLAHAFTFICMLAHDLDVYLKHKKTYQGPPRNLGTSIKNDYPLDDSFRYEQFKLRSGEPIKAHSTRFELDEKKTKIAAKRYGQNQFAIIHKMNIEDASKELFRLAKIMLKKDGSYLAMVFIRTPDGYMPTAVTFSDRSEKILFSHMLAMKVKRLKGDAVIFITEAWVSRDIKRAQQRIDEGKEVSGMRNKLEALTLMMLSKNNDTLAITSMFHHSKTGSILFGEDTIEHPEAKSMGFLLPVLKLWENS